MAKRLFSGLFTILLVVLPLMTACQTAPATPAATPKPPAATSTQPSAAKPASAPTAAAKPAAVPVRISVAVVAEPDTLDPASTKMSPNAVPVTGNVFDPLVEIGPDRRAKPGIATWKVLEGGKVFEFALNKGIKFHGGDPLTARDVEFTWKRYSEKSADFMNNLRFFDRLEVVDDYTIRIIFKEPNALFLTQTAPGLFIESKSYYDKVGEDKFRASPVGTGPYKFVEWKSGQYIDLAANDEYWGGAPQVKQARIMFAAEASTRVAMLQTGEVSIVMNTPWQNVAALEQAGFKRYDLPTVPGIGIQFHMKNPNVPWANVKVRQAIAHAIDREGIVKKLFFGVPKVDAWLAPSDLGYDPSLKPYPYDLAKAKQLLAEAGYVNGFDMPLYYWVGGPVAGVKDVTDYVVSAFQQIGIRPRLQVVEGPAMMDMIRKWSADPKAEAVVVSTPGIANGEDPVVPLNMMFYGPNPMGLYANPKLDGIIEQTVKAVDDSQRAELVKQAFKMIDADLPMIPILSNTNVFMFKSDIEYQPALWGRYMYLKNVKIK